MRPAGIHNYFKGISEAERFQRRFTVPGRCRSCQSDPKPSLRPQDKFLNTGHQLDLMLDLLEDLMLTMKRICDPVCGDSTFAQHLWNDSRVGASFVAVINRFRQYHSNFSECQLFGVLV